MYIVRFECPNCKINNKQEIILPKKNTAVICSVCNYSMVTIVNVRGCFMVLSNKLGLVKIIYSPLDYKAAIKEFNKGLKKKPKFKLEAVFISNSKNPDNVFSKISKNRTLKKHKAYTEKLYFKIEVPEAISVLSSILKKKPKWIYNQEYMAPRLPGF